MVSWLFQEFVWQALQAAGTTYDDGRHIVHLGNTRFWVEAGELQWSMAPERWDRVAIYRDLSAALQLRDAVPLMQVECKVEDEPGLPFDLIARAAGYALHVWGSVEHGDDADTVFWKKTGAAFDGAVSAATFASDADAWRDCCLSNGLLNVFQDLAAQHGCQILRTDFLRFAWQASDGVIDIQRYATPDEAALACCLHHHLGIPSESPLPDSTPTR